MKQFRKSRALSFVVGIALALAVGATAAWLIITYSGLGGSAGGFGQTSQTQTIGALTLVASTDVADLTGNGFTNPYIEPSGSSPASFRITNNSAAQVAIQTVVVSAITSDKPLCDTSGLSFNPAGDGSNPMVGRIYPAGTTGQLQIITGAWTATAGLDPDCSGAKFSVALTGTTQP